MPLVHHAAAALIQRKELNLKVAQERGRVDMKYILRNHPEVVKQTAKARNAVAAATTMEPSTVTSTPAVVAQTVAPAP